MNSAGEGNWGDPWGAVPESYHKGWPTGKLVDMTKLKPCPFCGSTEIHTYEPTMYEIGNDASVNCENPICGAEVRGDSLKEAIAKWNRRVE